MGTLRLKEANQSFPASKCRSQDLGPMLSDSRDCIYSTCSKSLDPLKDCLMLKDKIVNSVLFIQILCFTYRQGSTFEVHLLSCQHVCPKQESHHHSAYNISHESSGTSPPPRVYTLNFLKRYSNFFKAKL